MTIYQRWNIATGIFKCPHLYKRVQREDVLPSDIVELDHGTLQKRTIGQLAELGLLLHPSNCQ